MRFFWHKRRDAVREGIFGKTDQARMVRGLFYEYAELRSRPRVPLLGRRWMPRVVTSDEALILLGRRQVIDFLERVAGLSEEQLGALEGRDAAAAANERRGD